MRSVGVRELRQRASELLRAVEAGDTIEVTDRGRPVARLSPIANESRRDRLIRRGAVLPASADLLDLAQPVEPRRGKSLPTKMLERMRSRER